MRDIADQVLNAQAELQTALGFFRLLKREAELEQDDFVHEFNADSHYIEMRLQASLAMLHSLLAEINLPMANAAQMPEGWTPA